MKVKYILAFAAGVAAGAGGSAYYFKKHFEKVADEEIEQVAAAYAAELDEVYAKFGEDTHENVEVSDDDGVCKVNTVNESMLADIYKEREEGQKINYSDPTTIANEKKQSIIDAGYATQYFVDDDHTIEKNQNIIINAGYATSDSDIYEISEEEFVEDTVNFKKTLQYFVDDHTIFDPEELAVLMPDQCIGLNGVSSIQTADDVYSLYFRNEKEGCDYEVTRVAGSYYG